MKSSKDMNYYVGLDVHKHHCDVKIMSSSLSIGNVVKLSPYNGEILSRFLHKQFPLGRFRCVYEAGFSGFWLQRELSSLGIECIIVNAADVPSTHKESMQKNDKIDAIKLARTLRGGGLTGIYIPTKEQERLRSLVRQRSRINKAIRRLKNQIKSHYNFQGLHLDWEEGNMPKYWSRNKIRQLEEDAIKRNDPAMIGYLDAVKSLRKEELKSLRRIREESQTERYKGEYECLRSIRGIGSITAMIFISELMTMTRFKEFDQLQSFVGLIPTQNSSGDKDLRGRLTKRSNTMVKVALNQCAWSVVRYNPEMSIYYEDQKKRLHKSQKAIVKVMVKVLRKIRYEWYNYEKSLE